MCIEQTIWYPCLTHAAMKPITQYCPRFDREASRQQDCGAVKDLDVLVAPALRAHLDEPCPYGCEPPVQPIQWSPLVKSGSKKVGKSLAGGLRRARQGVKEALR
ncbi:uncharacterized protein PG998_000039 [Apiospora kogelbergensis]|uniref:Uncharacterized protein n=1 Tax=Apiospora kogelbergensis TaxID=1337665 RepID=A0AAW0QYF2_9PEZI